MSALEVLHAEYRLLPTGVIYAACDSVVKPTGQARIQILLDELSIASA